MGGSLTEQEIIDCKNFDNNLYKGIARIDQPIMFTDVKSAEIIKYASNAMLATRISFMNPNSLSQMIEMEEKIELKSIVIPMIPGKMNWV